MTNANKALLIIVAITALAVGFIANTSKVESDVSSEQIVNAKLLTYKDEQPESTIKDNLGELTLINFWASWCTPCREEMPMFQHMHDKFSQQGFQIIGIAIDTPDKAQPMLDSMGINYPILYAEKTGSVLMESVGNPNGLMPYSLLVDANGEIIEQKLGLVKEADIENWVDQHLARN